VPSEAARQRLVEFGVGVSQVRSELEAGRSLGHVVIATVTLAGGLVRHYEHLRDRSPNHERRADAERVLEDLRSLCRAAQSHAEQHQEATLTGFLDHAAGLHAQEVDAATDHRITVSTIHRAKDRLLITHVAERGRRPTGGPSRFIAEAGLAPAAQPLAA
jgi:ATP-dependent DNA helicase UvrD/PcrA